MFAGIAYTRYKLGLWGKYHRVAMPAYPTATPYLNQRTAKGHEPEPPQDIQQIDAIILRADPEDKYILIVGYTQYGTIREKAARLQLAKSTFYRKLEQAEWFVHSELDIAGQQTVYTR